MRIRNPGTLGRKEGVARREKVFFVRVRKPAENGWHWLVRESGTGRVARGTDLRSIGDAITALLEPSAAGRGVPARRRPRRVPVRQVAVALALGLAGYVAVQLGSEGVTGLPSGLSGAAAVLLLFGIGLPAIMASWYLLYRIVLGRAPAPRRRSVSGYAFVTSLFACFAWLILLEALLRRFV